MSVFHQGRAASAIQLLKGTKTVGPLRVHAPVAAVSVNLRNIKIFLRKITGVFQVVLVAVPTDCGCAT